MMQMTTKEINKLKKVDRIMFNLEDSSTPKKDILQAGKLLQDLKLIDDPKNAKEVIQAYAENLSAQENKVIRRETVTYNLTTLQQLQEDPDNNELVVQPCKQDFREYALKVLRFNDQLAALRTEMNGQNYRVKAGQIDRERTDNHNACLSDINMINRLAVSKKLPAFSQTSKSNPDRTDYGQAIVKSCCDHVVQYLQKLDV